MRAMLKLNAIITSGMRKTVVLNLFYISSPLLSNKISTFTPNTFNGAHFLKIWN